MFDIQKYVYGPTITIDGTKYRKMDIDKGTAELILENLYSGQRNRAESWATTIGRSMAAGHYKANNGQTIVFDEDGNLLDGQHRIEAIAKTGIEQTFRIAIVKADEADKQFQTIDNNMKRSTALYMRGTCKNIRTAIAIVDYCIRFGQTGLLSSLQGKASPKALPSRDEIISHNDQNFEYIDKILRQTRAMRAAIGKGSYKSIGAFISVVRFCGTDELLDEFVDDFVNITPDSKTVQAVINQIQKQYVRGTATPKYIFGVLLDAYEHYRAMDESTMFNKQNRRIEDYDKMVSKMRESASKTLFA